MHPAGIPRKDWDVPVLAKEVSAAIEMLREAASAAEPPKKDGHKSMPKHILQLMPGFACAVMREAEKDNDKTVLKNAADAVMTFLEPFTTRANLLVRIRNQWESVKTGLPAADKVLQEEIAKRAKSELESFPFACMLP